jgi:hypothetical protein
MLDFIYKRRSIRKYKPDPLPKELITEMPMAARRRGPAPTTRSRGRSSSCGTRRRAARCRTYTSTPGWRRTRPWLSSSWATGGTVGCSRTAPRRPRTCSSRRRTWNWAPYGSACGTSGTRPSASCWAYRGSIGRSAWSPSVTRPRRRSRGPSIRKRKCIGSSGKTLRYS